MFPGLWEASELWFLEAYAGLQNRGYLKNISFVVTSFKTGVSEEYFKDYGKLTNREFLKNILKAILSFIIVGFLRIY